MRGFLRFLFTGLGKAPVCRVCSALSAQSSAASQFLFFIKEKIVCRNFLQGKDDTEPEMRDKGCARGNFFMSGTLTKRCFPVICLDLNVYCHSHMARALLLPASGSLRRRRDPSEISGRQSPGTERRFLRSRAQRRSGTSRADPDVPPGSQRKYQGETRQV